MKLLSKGKTRTVYEYSKGTVIKIDKGKTSVSNKKEYENWLLIKNTPFKKYFAPCIQLLSNGNLVMVKAQQKNNRYPKLTPFYMPKFLKDIKISNFGVYHKRPVICDYTGLYPLSDELILIDPTKYYCNACKIEIHRPFFISNPLRLICEGCAKEELL